MQMRWTLPFGGIEWEIVATDENRDRVLISGSTTQARHRANSSDLMFWIRGEVRRGHAITWLKDDYDLPPGCNYDGLVNLLCDLGTAFFECYDRECVKVKAMDEDEQPQKTQKTQAFKSWIEAVEFDLPNTSLFNRKVANEWAEKGWNAAIDHVMASACNLRQGLPVE